MTLVKLEVKDEVIENLISRAKELEKERTKENTDTLFLEIIENGINLDFYFKPLNQFDGYEECPDGFYINMAGILIPLNETVQAKGKKVDNFMIFHLDENGDYAWNDCRSCDGLCDSWKDVVENYPELEDENREFCVMMNYVSHENMNKPYWSSDDCGHYYGKYDSVYDNEDGIFRFWIHEFVTETASEKIDKLGIFNRGE